MITLVFFGGAWRSPHFRTGALVLVSGPVSTFRGRLQMQNPEYEVLGDEEEAALHTGRLFPVYPLTRGLTQRQLRTWIRFALDRMVGELEDPLPSPLRERYKLLPLAEALAAIHYPVSPEARHQAFRRLAFEELFLDQVFVQGVRHRREWGKKAEPIRSEGPLFRRIRASLPFTLTDDQESALTEILADMARPRPSHRLLQGDVGSGKTVVAFLAVAAAADSGLQTAFMVPTEILAEQHLRTFRELGAGVGLEPRLLVGARSGPARREILRDLAAGTAPLVVGTHALFQEDVRFHRLGLVIVDEQHRFGVVQRTALTEKGASPHVLVMSATPIPRSLALVRYADLDLSVIRHRPRGRGKVVTRVSRGADREKVYGFLAERLREGRQAYIIYPLVEESAKSDLRAATTMAGDLAERPEFRDWKVDLLHGQMKPAEKEEVMGRFVAGEIQVLVSTTVVEAGIDVPNATFLIVEHPERYGLSQLHQLRGRIGRGQHESYCVLICEKGMDASARDRLREFARIDDGFELARLDLALRGQGEVAGVRQSGRPAYRLADPIRDARMTEEAQREARRALESGDLTGDGGEAWEPLRRWLQPRLDEAGALADAG